MRQRRRWPHLLALAALSTIAIASSVALGQSSPAHGTAYYVDAVKGRDSNPGTSPGRAWRTLARVNAGTYAAGDTILLHGGQTFRGSLRFDPRRTRGGERLPITLTSYGGGRATIVAGRRDGIRVVNRAALHLTRLLLTGSDSLCRRGSAGILFDAQAVGLTLHHIHIDHVDASGFCYGILVSTEDNRSKFEDVRITYSRVHDNGSAGIQTFDPATSAHDIHDVYISHVTAYRNADNGGIALFGVDNGLVEHSVAYQNGARDHGGVGIWAFDSRHITIQFNVSYGNLSTAEDGDGFDFDGGVTDSVIQYNYSYGNVGIGYLVCGCVPYYAMHNDVVRYNVSVNDGSSGQPSGLFVYGGEPLSGVEIYNNTFVSSTSVGPIVDIDGGGHSYRGVHLRNNIFVAGAGKQLILVADPRNARDLRFQGNDYYSTGPSLDIQWGRHTYRTLAAWRRGTGAETLGRKPVGLSVAPGFCGPGTGTPGPSPSDYRLRPGSPLIGRGLNLRALFGLIVGSRDLFGQRIPVGHAFDVGATAHRPGRGCQ